MRRLTLKEVRENHGGLLPPDATFRADDDEPFRVAPARPAAKPAPPHKQSGRGERFALLNSFVDFSLGQLTRAEIAVWLILFRDSRTGTARTGYDDLARRAGCNRRNVGRAVRRLEKLGLLKTVFQGGLNRGSSRYSVQATIKDGRPRGTYTPC